MPYFGIPIRNGLPIGLGSVAGFGVQQFSPADLFSAGEQGAWYDPSDYSTLFQDSAGTTPVTAVEQFVGLMLDKSGRGNHATQTTSAKRPKLAARYNLLTYSEQFDNGDWLKFGVTISPNAGTAPDGTTTADLIYPSSTGTDRALYRGGFASISKTHSVAAKAAGKNWFCIYQEDTTGGAAWFDLANGTVGTVAAGFANATITPLGNGWYRCSVTSTSSFNQYTAFAPVDADNSNTLTVNSTDGALIWGADLRPASQATGLIGPTYQRVVDAATYDTVGFLPYLQFDGLSWSMSTNSIDFTATDKMTVWAGVRKQADPPDAMLCELSAVFTNAGTFAIAAPWTSTTLRSYFFLTRGDAVNSRGYTGYAAPITNVLSAALQSSAADSDAAQNVRINAVDVAGTSISSNISTGNFGNHSLFIGARNNASLFFNGWLTSLIVRGAQSTQSQIEATESWVAGKTGVSI